MTIEKVKPGVYVRIGGQERRIVFDHWAFSAISEDDDGRDRLGLLIKGKVDLDVIIFLLWAGLLRDHAELEGATREERRKKRRIVAEWLEADDVDTAELAEAVGRALMNASPITKTKKKMARAAERSTG